MYSLRRLWVYLQPYWKWVIIGPLLMALEVTMDLLQPTLLERIIDVGIAQLDMQVVIRTGLTMIGLALVGFVGGGGNTVVGVRVGQAFGADLRQALFARVQTLSFGNLDRIGTGHLVTRLTNDVTQVQEALMMTMRMLVRVPLLLVGSILMAIITSPNLAVLILVLAPFVAALSWWVITKAFPLFSRVQQRLDRLNTVMQENLSGVRIVKAFVRERHEEERFGQANEALMNQTIQAMRVMVITMPLMMLAVNLGMVAALWFGGVDISEGTMKVGQLVAFINYLQTALREMLMVSMLLTSMSRALASADRIAEVLDSVPEIVDAPNAQTQVAGLGRVAFENVSFGYNGGHHGDAVLRNVSFVAEPGERVAILGATGSGKSTLVNLIPRFYDVESGRITVDGVDVRDLTQAALRQQIGIALQEAVLFTGTIRDNIRYGRPEASDEQVLEAAKAAQAHEFITQLPNGYDTVLGQRGVNLSGGQKQRIAIARALLVQPHILILDDSTSAVDVETEARIQEALGQIMKQRTSFVIAQRISTVLNADKILVLDQGELVAEGNHESLMVSSPVYQEIYESQLGNGARANV
jgi:ATP-binding cassette subfamily B protein